MKMTVKFLSGTGRQKKNIRKVSIEEEDPKGTRSTRTRGPEF